ncbi:hypothetical protein LJE71_09370 [Xanthobacter autotrophicus]|uniref:hypothetical protein n=1 Tax=Xanthobacter autotrophicus TaxID=280 RepID=UPI001E4D2683|nr:hypothetical protein [Xanthobacter autotrophicus]UDQ91176.1 hypothetical protein LJE71_09370 [Xanthobacter autotrophicus]
MFPHVSSAHPRPLFARHRRLIHASSEAIIGAWCDPALFTSLDTTEPHMGVTLSIDPAATHRASITLGTPHGDTQERLPLCVSYQPADSGSEQYVAGPVDDPDAMRLCLALSPTLHLVASADNGSTTPRTYCSLLFGAMESVVSRQWAIQLVVDALRLLAEGLAERSAVG